MGESSPTIGSFGMARQANGSVLTRKAAHTSSDDGTFGRTMTSPTIESSSAGANRSCTFISCGVWLSIRALVGFLRTAITRQKANLYFLLRYLHGVSGCVL